MVRRAAWRFWRRGGLRRCADPRGPLYDPGPRQRQESWRALELLNVEREYVPALVCLSQGYLMLKQAPKARNHLKRVAKMPFVEPNYWRVPE